MTHFAGSEFVLFKVSHLILCFKAISRIGNLKQNYPEQFSLFFQFLVEVVDVKSLAGSALGFCITFFVSLCVLYTTSIFKIFIHLQSKSPPPPCTMSLQHQDVDRYLIEL